MTKQSPFYKIVMVGNEGVGKSTLAQVFTRKKYATDELNKKVSYQTTVELQVGQYSKVDILNSRQDDFAAIRNNDYRSGDGFMCVFSLADSESFAAIAQFREQIIKIKETESVPMILIGNKSDLTTINETVKSDAVRQQAVKWNITYIETSAKSKLNVEEAFMNLLHDIKKRKQQIKKINKKHKLKQCAII